MAQPRFLVYGANGYTGQLVAQECARRGLLPVLAGRNEAAIRALAEPLGMPHRAFALENTHALEAALAEVDAILLCAGPFSATSQLVVDACLHTGRHYLDITGEIAVFEAIHRRHAEADGKNVVLLPGVGFDVVPSDCLARRLAESLPGATHLVLAFSGGVLSRGTAKTMVEGAGQGGAVRENGVIRRVPMAWKTSEIPFHDRSRLCMTIPWGDVSTAYYSTGIPNIMVYAGTSEAMVQGMRLARPFMGALAWGPVKSWVQGEIERRMTGPTDEQRARARVQLWGWVYDDHGNERTATATTPEGYTFTAAAAVESVVRLLSRRGLRGALTPSMAFGAGFLEELPGCELRLSDAPAGI